MKQLGVVILSLLVTIQAMPLSLGPVVEEISLPDARAGEVYRTDIEVVLRDQYRLKIDTGTRESILQWFVVDGEVPPGISVERNGVLTGTPTARREQPYHFRLKVVDAASRNTESLVIEFALRVIGAQIRLTKIKSVALVPIDGSASREGNNAGPNKSADDEVDTAVAPETDSLVSTPSNSLIREKADNGLTSQNMLPTTVAISTNSTVSSLHFDMDGKRNQSQDCTPSTKSGNAFSNLFRRANKDRKPCLTINMPANQVPEPLQVPNGTTVTVRGQKRLVDTCTVETKREELPPEPDPIAQILKIVAAFGTIPAGIEAAKPSPSPTPSPTPYCPKPSGLEVPENDTEAAQVEIELASIDKSLLADRTEIETLETNYKDMAKKIRTFTNCPDPCNDIGQYNSQKATLEKELKPIVDKPITALKSTELQLTSLMKVVAARYRKPGGPKEEVWIEAVNERLDCLVKNLAALQSRHQSLAFLHAEFAKIFNILESYTPETTYSQDLIADADAKVTGTVTCTNVFTKQPGDPIPFTITYQNFPRASVSAGVLLTLLDKREIGTQPIRTGTAADGTPTFRVNFAETDRASSQLVPFSFFNYYLSGTRALNLNLSGGIGVNPNNGSTQVEYFFGGALGHKNVFFQFGGHVGRWQELGGGFNVGETVPENFPSSLPITRRYSVRPGFGISYRLPLP